MKKPKIFVACDTNNINQVKKIISQTKCKDLDIGYKFGLEFFYSKGGREFISKLKREKIFLDLKISDISATSSAAIRSLKDLKNISYITVHANAGYETLKAVKKMARKTNKKLKVLVVTILTSFSNSSLKKIGHTRSVKELVKRQVMLAKKCGCDGIVCAGSDLKIVKKIFKGEIITPGIRLKGDSSNDQVRVTSPSEAFKNGSTSLVMGRSLTKGNIKKNLQKLLQHLI
tara:strand:- start:152 stop:841 length:690 start_codon:yes stop_codon:yes gene_type:complete